MAGDQYPRDVYCLFAVCSAIYWCLCIQLQAVGAVQVFPNSYEIRSAAVYNDTACSPASNKERPTPNAPVSCFMKQTGDTPKLNDTELGPQNGLPSPTTDVAYTLGGPSKTGLFETWIVFKFVGHVSLSHVTLHYYCTGTPPQLQHVAASGMATSIMTPSCGDAAHRQFLTFSIIQLVIVLSVKRNGGYFYLTEVQFFNEPTPPHPGPTPTTTITPNGPNSPDHTPTANNTVDYTAITPESPNSPGHTPTADNTVDYTAITPESPNSSGPTPTSTSTQDIPTLTIIVDLINSLDPTSTTVITQDISLPSIRLTPTSLNTLDIPTQTSVNTMIFIPQRSLPIAAIAGTCVGVTAFFSVIILILILIVVFHHWKKSNTKKRETNFSTQGHYSMQYHNPNGDSTEMCPAAENHSLIPSTGQEELSHAQGNISETIIDSKYHCDQYSVIASPSAVADFTADPTYTTLDGTKTAVLEDTKSHCTETGSEMPPQHCTLEKETDEDELKSLADPNAVYAAVDKSKQRKNQNDEDDAPAVQISHVITDSGATYAAVHKPSKKAAIAQDQEKTRRRNPPPAPAPYQEQSCPPKPPPYTDHVETHK